METNVERKVVCVTLEDHEYIGELYKRITESYKAMATLAGVKPKWWVRRRTQDQTHH